MELTVQAVDIENDLTDQNKTNSCINLRTSKITFLETLFCYLLNAEQSVVSRKLMFVQEEVMLTVQFQNSS